MSAALALCLLMQNLEVLNRKEGSNTKLKKHIEDTKQKSKTAQDRLMKIQKSKKNPTVEKLEKNLLKNIYNVDDQIDAFFVRKELHKRKRFAKGFFLNRSMSVLAESILSFTEEIAKFTKDFDDQQQSVDTPKAKESEKHAEPVSEKPVAAESGKPAEQASEKPAGGESGKPAEQASKEPAGGGESEKPAEQASEKPAGGESGKPAEQASKKPAGGGESEKPAEQVSKKPAGGESGKPAEQASEKPAEGESGKPAEQASEKPAGGESGKPTEQASEKPAGGGESEKPAEQASEKPAGGESGKPAEQASEKPAGGGERGKPAEQASEKPAGGESGKPAEGKIEKAAERVSPVDDQRALTNTSAEPDKKHSEPGEATSAEKVAPQQLKATLDLSDEDSEFIGREDEAKSLIEALLNNRKLCFLVSVVGAAGSGKTTLVRNVYNRADVTQHFPLRAWINASEELSESGSDDVNEKMKNLMLDILKQVTAIKDEEKLPLEKLEEKVRDFFIRKRFLVVLDDVKTHNIQAKLEQAFANSLNGSRLVSITRDRQIATSMNDKGLKPIELLSLDTEKSWKLFVKKVPKFEGLNDPSELKELIKEKCQGLPLTIVVLAGLLSTKDSSTWIEQVKHLDFGEDPSKAILSLAYQELPAALKPCLLYLGIFPKEYEVPVRRLYRLWTAEGLVNPAPNDDTHKELFDTSLKGETPEELVENYLNALITRNMIEVARPRLDGSPKTCRVPGILHDTVFPYATEVGFFNVVKSQDYQQKVSIRRIAAYADISNHPLDDCLDNLRSYISFNTRKGDTPAIEVDKFLKLMIKKRGFSLLTVLDLEKVYKPDLSDQAIEKLINLTYLGLRWTFLDSIPESVGNLPNLETLDVKHTNINSLPVSIWNSKKLRHLYMNEIYLNLPSTKPPSSGALSNLLTLWGLIISKKSPGKDWLNSLVHLTKLGITFRFKDPEEISPWISKCTKLKSLKLRSTDEYSRPSKLKLDRMDNHKHLSELYLLGKLSKKNEDLGNIEDLGLPQNLKMVTLSLSNLTEDPMRTLGKLPKLKILRLFARSYTGEKMNCEDGEFPELRVLKLWMLEQLNEWIVQKGSMPRLKELEIRRCDQLKETTGWQHLNSLKDVILTNMPTTFAAAIRSTMKEKRNLTITEPKLDFLPLPKDNLP